MQHKRWLYLLLLIPLTLTWLGVLLELPVWVGYRTSWSAGFWIALYSATSFESDALMGYIKFGVAPLMILATIMYIVGCWAIWRTSKSLNLRTILITLIANIVLLLPFIIPNTPASLVSEAVGAAKQTNYIKKHNGDSYNFTYNACRRENNSLPELYVFALGESLRYDNLSLNGIYNRHTTPLLERQEALCLYSNYYSTATLTQYALPILLTGISPENYKQHFERKTFISPLHEVGFYTALVTQHAQLLNTDLFAYLKNDFDTIIVVAHDSLIAPTINLIAQIEGNVFIMAHYLGNHFFYNNHPDDYYKWLPDYNLTPNAKNDSLFWNAYDNSVLYTDKILVDAIKTLEANHKQSALLFTSDHGDYLKEYIGGHGMSQKPTKDEYHVPLMVWYSNEYKEAYPEKVANLIKHKDAPVCADHVFWSVLDMADIRIDSTLQQEGMSVFGDTLLPHRRTLLLPDGRSVLTLD